MNRIFDKLLSLDSRGELEDFEVKTMLKYGNVVYFHEHEEAKVDGYRDIVAVIMYNDTPFIVIKSIDTTDMWGDSGTYFVNEGVKKEGGEYGGYEIQDYRKCIYK